MRPLSRAFVRPFVSLEHRHTYRQRRSGRCGAMMIMVTRTIVTIILKMHRPPVCLRVDLVEVPLDVAFPAEQVYCQSFSNLIAWNNLWNRIKTDRSEATERISTTTRESTEVPGCTSVTWTDLYTDDNHHRLTAHSLYRREVRHGGTLEAELRCRHKWNVPISIVAYSAGCMKLCRKNEYRFVRSYFGIKW